MPKRKYGGRSSRRKRRRYKKKYKLYRRLRTPLPKKLLVKLKYAEVFTINPAANTIGSYIFSANGMYDPNITGVGHQPRGFDQLMTMYDHFTVVGSKISAQAVSSTSTANCFTALTLQDDTTALTPGSTFGGTNIMEYRKTRYAPFPQLNTSGQQITHKKHKLKFSAKKFFSISKPLSTASLKGNESSNPAEGAYYIVYYWSESGSDPGPILFHALVTFTAVLTEPKQPIES